jgi:hypothetical protein
MIDKEQNLENPENQENLNSEENREYFSYFNLSKYLNSVINTLYSLNSTGGIEDELEERDEDSKTDEAYVPDGLDEMKLEV